MSAVMNESPKAISPFLKRLSSVVKKPSSPNTSGTTTKYTGKSHSLPVRPSSVGSGLLRLMMRIMLLTTNDEMIIVTFFMSVV